MAGRIKGITVEIGGDTTGLAKALKNVNNNIKQTQSALKDVERLLKLDPSNTELLTQKQKLLKDAVAATSEKLNTLKEAQAQAKEQLERGELGQDKYDALQREIVETEQQLKSLTDQLKTFGSVGVQQAAAVGEKMSEVGDKISSVGDKISGFGEGMTKTVTAGVVAVGAASVAAWTEVDEAMDTVVIKTGATGDALEDLQSRVTSIAESIPTSFEAAANAVGEVNTRFGLTGQACEDLSTAFIKFAELNDTDVSTSVDSVQNALAAFNMDADEASTLLDVLNRTGQNTGANVMKMADALTTNAAALQEMGMNAYQSVNFLGQLELAGTDSATVVNGMKTALKNATKDGKSFGEAMQSLEDTILNGTDGMDGLTAAYELFGKSGAAIYQAVKSGQLSISDLASTTDILADATDSVGKTYESTLDPIDQFKVILNTLKSTGAELATLLMEMLVPVIEKLKDGVSKLKAWWEGLSEAQQKNIITIAGIAAAAGPVITIIGKMVSGVGGLVSTSGKLLQALPKIQGALAAIPAPVLAVVAIIAVLVAAFKHLWDTNEEFRNNIIGTWNTIKETISGFCQGIVDRLNAMGFEFGSITDVIKAVWDGFCNFLAPIFEGAFSIISTVLSTVLEHILNVVDFFTAVFHGDWSAAWEAVKNIFSNLWEGILSVLSTILDTMKGVLDTVLGWFGTSWETVWTSIKDFFVNIWTGIKDFFVNTWNSIKTAVSNIVDGIKTKITNVFTAVKTTVSDIFNGIKETATTVWNAIKTAITTPIEAAKEKVKSVIDAIKGFFSGLKLELPHIKLPHFSVSGTLSISPPSVPKLSIDWYKAGGIMTKPTIFGMNGMSLMAGGEAGQEAILPLSEFYTRLENMLSGKLGTGNVERYLSVIAANSGKGIYLDDGTLVGRLLPIIDNELGKTEKLNRRLAL